MRILKARHSPTSETADNSRRSFFWKFGAGVSGALAAPAVIAGNEAGNESGLSLQVALLEQEKILRKFHQAFEDAMDSGRYEDVVELFTDDAQVVFNGGVFDNRRRGISRLYRDRFQSTKTGKRIEPAPGFELDPREHRDEVEVSQDLLSATAVFPYSIQAGMVIDSDSSLVSMARLHGEGVRRWWEGGEYHVTYRKEAAAGLWRISRLEYNTLARADYRPGRTNARPISIKPFATRYPADRHGPDALTG